MTNGVDRPVEAEDRLLDDLQLAIADYQSMRERWDRERADLKEARQEVERQRERAEQLAESLRGIHRSLFDGNVYSLILKACLTLTGATRGIYATAAGPDDRLRLRAAFGMSGYPKQPPSPFIEALCRRVLDDNESVVCNKGDELDGLPAPASESEHFHNCLVVPVVLLHNFDGIIIAADKLTGPFDKEDEATLLSVGNQATVAVENTRLHLELQQAYLATIMILADAMEVKDPYTHGHCEQVSRYALFTARKLDLSPQETAIVRYAALLHDVGKIGVSDGVLNKPGPLLPEELELMRAHVRVGRDLICKIEALSVVGEAVLHHHEWYDGTGYPDGLSGDEIPITARIVSVVDAYCAMITKRSYKEAYGEVYAREELERCAGTQFDPHVVQAFLEVLHGPEADDSDDESNLDSLLPGFPRFA